MDYSTLKILMAAYRDGTINKHEMGCAIALWQRSTYGRIGGDK